MVRGVVVWEEDCDWEVTPKPLIITDSPGSECSNITAPHGFLVFFFVWEGPKQRFRLSKPQDPEITALGRFPLS